ncbi:histidine phosphatase family protein [Halalkalibacterium halodurans]|uniref:histidine phosphatase family protein n=1 Tax=Halalkalibacterium halodurans TaxID=86665 RepID=UPI001067BD7A|nr:histidine phosphatase family protein [Halalkalibacterium halodurans]TES56348.1 histidine phosphatase family protein [Halalkalibacterium halodurans]
MGHHVDILLIRHSLTVCNEQKRYNGWKDEHLSPNGRAAAQMLSQRMPLVDCVCSSDLTRACETASILFPGHEIQAFPEFREVNFGCWEGKRYDELMDEPSYRQWLEDAEQFYPPDGETLPTFYKRVNQGWEKLLQEANARKAHRLAVVTHAGVIRVLLDTWARREDVTFWDWKIPFGVGYWIFGTYEKERKEFQCISLQEEHFMESTNG